MSDIDSQTITALFILAIIVVCLIGVFSHLWNQEVTPIEMFHEVTNLVEFVGGPLDGQRGHPWDQSEYIFRRSTDPERAVQNIGVLYRRVEGTRHPVRYKFDGYGEKHLTKDCQEI